MPTLAPAHPQLQVPAPSSPTAYRGYAIYDKLGAAIWKKNPISEIEYIADHKDGTGFVTERINQALPPVRGGFREARTLEAAKGKIDFLLKFGTYDCPGEVTI